MFFQGVGNPQRCGDANILLIVLYCSVTTNSQKANTFPEHIINMLVDTSQFPHKHTQICFEIQFTLVIKVLEIDNPSCTNVGPAELKNK
jgi:hypothetical protein